MSPEAREEREPRCPQCGRPVSWDGNRFRPFCSVSCKLVDLGSWLDEGYRVPGDAVSSEPGADPPAPGPR